MEALCTHTHTRFYALLNKILLTKSPGMIYFEKKFFTFRKWINPFIIHKKKGQSRVREKNRDENPPEWHGRRHHRRSSRLNFVGNLFTPRHISMKLLSARACRKLEMIKFKRKGVEGRYTAAGEAAAAAIFPHCVKLTRLFRNSLPMASWLSSTVNSSGLRARKKKPPRCADLVIKDV